MIKNKSLLLLTLLLAGSMVNVCLCSHGDLAVVNPSTSTVQVHPDGSLDFKKGITQPEFVPAKEWQDILPGQGIPVVSPSSMSHFPLLIFIMTDTMLKL